VSQEEIAVTGVGAVSPAGIGVDVLWQALNTGISLSASDQDLAGLPVDFCCRVPGFDATALLGRRLTWRQDRFTHLALAAAREAVADAGLDPADWDPSRVAVVLGVCGNSLEHYESAFVSLHDGHLRSVSPVLVARSVPNAVAGELAMDLGATGPGFIVSSACASGNHAIGVARDLLRSGACDVAITGGADSVCNRGATIAFWRMRVLSCRTDDPRSASRPFDTERDGFVLGEGAGVLILERISHAKARGSRVRGYVGGYGASMDAYHFTAPHPEGQGAAQAISVALADAGLQPSDIGHVNAHGTSTPLNDLAEARALHKVFTTPPPVTSAKSVIGHAIGASGALEAIATLLTLEHQSIPPTANLDHLDPEIDLDVVSHAPRPARMKSAVTNSFGFGGQNAVLVLNAPLPRVRVKVRTRLRLAC
jgi:3-oxoacyl-[acyl-carrier-protein] synthase II